MKQLSINIDSKGYKTKPTSNEIGNITNRLKCPQSTTAISIEDLQAAICNGQTFTGGVLSGTSAKDWVRQEVFVWDFDNNAKTLPHLTPKEVKDIMCNLCKTNAANERTAD